MKQRGEIKEASPGSRCYQLPQSNSGKNGEQIALAVNSKDEHEANLNGGSKRQTRDIVLDVIRSKWATVNQIAQETGLSRAQVQGVIYARDLKAKKALEKTSAPGGQSAYRLKAP
jgi:predicted transcriptional regulator